MAASRAITRPERKLGWFETSTIYDWYLLALSGVIWVPGGLIASPYHDLVAALAGWLIAAFVVDLASIAGNDPRERAGLWIMTIIVGLIAGWVAGERE